MTIRIRAAARPLVPLVRLALLVLLVLLVPFASPAQGAADARAVLARYAEVTNAAKYATIPGHRVKGTVDLPAAGLSGTMEGFADQSGRVVQVVTFAGIGEMKEGVDTAFAWSLNLIEGPKLIEGKEFVEKREREDPLAARRDPAIVLDAQALGDTTLDGDACVKVRLTWKSGRQTTECYSRKTGLLVYIDAVETFIDGPDREHDHVQ